MVTPEELVNIENIASLEPQVVMRFLSESWFHFIPKDIVDGEVKEWEPEAYKMDMAAIDVMAEAGYSQEEILKYKDRLAKSAEKQVVNYPDIIEQRHARLEVVKSVEHVSPID